MQRHPNHAKMQKAVAGWIASARLHLAGGELLRSKAAWVEKQLRILGKPCGEVPAHLEGLTAADLTVAHGDLLVAADEWDARLVEARAKLAGAAQARAA
jgi:hypothetical protein